VSRATPGLRDSFEGLNFFDQRYANGGNQFSIEPPDQGICVGNGYVLETVNDVLRVYGVDGRPRTGVVDLNTFYGYPAQLDRTTNKVGPFVTDPSCIYDQATDRFYHVVLTLDVDPSTGEFLGPNHLDLAVSRSGDPTGRWAIYRIPVQDDGTEGTPNHHCDPGPSGEAAPNPTACIGDFPHIGADAHGIYLTTNEYCLFCEDLGYQGAQIYALSKRTLTSAAGQVPMVQFSTGAGSGNELDGEPGFTVWPAVSPRSSDFATVRNGTEYFASSNAAEEARGEGNAGSSSELGLWALSGTASLDTASPQLTLRNGTEHVKRYVPPPPAHQKPGPIPLAQCINDRSVMTEFGRGCWRLLFDTVPSPRAKLSTLDSGDSRVYQVVYTGGRLYTTLGTGVRVGDRRQAGGEWFVATPQVQEHTVSGNVHSDYVAVRRNNLTYPTIAKIPDGPAVVSFTLVGRDHYPSLAYSRIFGTHLERTVRIAAVGAAPQDGFSGYEAFGPPFRPRWGDYGASAVSGQTLWFAGEYIAHSCTFREWLADPTCGGTRGPLGNWSTSVNAFVP
jgi:hypothetical protein